MKFEIIAHPNSKNPRVEKDLFGKLHIYINEPPLEGRANEAAIEALSEYLNVKKYQVSLIGGAKSKYKVFRINL